MAFVMRPNVRYRMPVVFGPTPGPRQKADGTPWTTEETGTMTAQWLAIKYLTAREKIENLLPPCFALRGEPVVAVSFSYFKNLWWLAGRGYGIVFVDVPVVFTGTSETIEGHFCLVMWEGSPDAIMTGREELGFPKLFADIPEFAADEQAGTLEGFAEWLGFKFVEFKATDLQPVEPNGTVPGSGGPAMFYKYMPRTSPFGREGGDLAYVTTSAPAPGEQSLAAPLKIDESSRRWEGKGELRWNRASFEQLPLTYHVVNGLAELDILEYRGAEMVEFSGPGTGVWANWVRAAEI
jgi:hypothetical protein